jgi:protein TIF31
VAGSTVKLIEDPYTEKEARMHMIRVREIIGAAGDRFDTIHGISAGISLHDTVLPWKEPDSVSASGKPSRSNLSGIPNPLADYNFEAPASIRTLLPPVQEPPPKTVKSISASPWNPPPPHLRQKGHFLYLLLTTNEGEQYQITSCVSGFFVNRSSNNKFDPFPRPAPKNAAAHSLFTLVGNLSPSFATSFAALLELNNKRDPLANFQLTNAIPSSPWLVDPATLSLSAHQADVTRSQETYLMSGIENTDTLRDWNEEIQSTKELPKSTVQERVFRERLIAKIYAEFNEAAARGAMMVARGEISPLNPTEGKDAQIFVYNNIFYSFGSDGVGTFTSEGGNAAARVAVGKDVSGVKAVNQLDICGLSTPGTIIVDYLGKRLVAQSIVPGIFKQREPEEHQVDYGGVEGRDVVAHNEAFVPAFASVSKALRVKKHPVWDKEGRKHILEGSVETKGLLGTDGRKYILDLYRLTPLDIHWIDQYWSDLDQSSKSKDRNYLHRMAVLRLELIDAYWRSKMGDYVKEKIGKRKRNSDGSSVDGEESPKPVENEVQPDTINGKPSKSIDDAESAVEQERVDISNFSLSFNPDVFCGQTPQTDEEKEEWAKDESLVRDVCIYLHKKVLPELVC